MFSQRGVLNLAHTSTSCATARAAHAIRLNGIDSEMLTPGRSSRRSCPILNYSTERALPDARRLLAARAAASPATTRSPGAMRAAPTPSASTSSRTARSPASAPRAARVTGVETTRGAHPRRARSAWSRPAHSSVLADMAGFRLPIESHPLQALVSEPIKPLLDMRGDVERGACLCQPVRQGRAGDRRAASTATTPTPSAAASSVIEETLRALVELFPIFARLQMLRQWGGIVDMTPRSLARSSADRRSRAFSSTAAGAPAASRRPRAPAGSSPQTIANGRPHPLAAPFALERFAERPADRRARRGRRGALTLTSPRGEVGDAIAALRAALVRGAEGLHDNPRGPSAGLGAVPPQVVGGGILPLPRARGAALTKGMPDLA